MSTCTAVGKVDFSFVTELLKILKNKKSAYDIYEYPTESSKTSLLQSFTPKISDHSFLKFKACQHLQWNEANVPVLMEMEVRKVSL